MNSILSTAILILFLQAIALPFVANAQKYDFFYFIQQWPGSICATKESCCLPKTGKPASDFIVLGLQPWNNLGGALVNCDPKSSFASSKLSNLTRSSLYGGWPSLACPYRDATKLWASQWKKYGTCSESDLNQDGYFRAAIKLKKEVNLLKILNIAGIKPNGSSYEYTDVYEAILTATRHMPGIQCNEDKYGNPQLNLIYQCGNAAGKTIECPGLSPSNCPGRIKFPSF